MKSTVGGGVIKLIPEVFLSSFHDSSETINLHLKLTCLIEMQPAVRHGE